MILHSSKTKSKNFSELWNMALDLKNDIVKGVNIVYM